MGNGLDYGLMIYSIGLYRYYYSLKSLKKGEISLWEKA